VNSKNASYHFRTKRLFIAAIIIIIILCFWVALYNAPQTPKKNAAIKTFSMDDEIAIGVLANEGTETCMNRWGSTAEYLKINVPGLNFTVIPLLFEEFDEGIEREYIDFVLTNPSMYIDLKVKYGVSRLLTMENTIFYEDYLRFGGVIFTKKENDEINRLEDIRGKSFAAVNKNSFGGWQMALKEFSDDEIDPSKDFKEIRFVGTHEAVVYDVLSGNSDAGTVRTDTLERMAKVGIIDLTDIKILNLYENPAFPFLLSTPLYPEWVFAKTRYVSDDLAHDVALALMAMSELNLAAMNAGIGGWTVPQDYTAVEDLLKDLKLSPYENYGQITFSDLIMQYRWFIIAILMAFIIFILYNIRLLSLSEAVSRALEHSRQMENKANEASTAKSMFVANISHEIRTPMNAIIGLSTLLFKTELNARQLDYTKKLYHSAKSLLGLINNILDFSKIEAGKMELENREFTFDEIVYTLSNLLTIKADQKEVELLFDISPDIPEKLKGDSGKLTQVLTNLIGNAIKFTEKGNIIVRIHSYQLPESKVKLYFEISDTGIGMATEQLSKLFTAFTQADASTTRKYGGTGLGLSITKQIIELMGGTISVESKVGLGTTFKFDVLLDFKPADSEEYVYPPNFSDQKILVVDDNAESRKIIRKTLEQFGFSAEEADSGTAAINILKQRPFRLIILDYKMPDLNGLETARMIRQMEKAGPEKTTKLMMISAYGKEEIKQEAELSGINHFLDKPVSPSLLYNTIMEMLGHKEFTKSGYDDRGTGREALRHSLEGSKILLVEDNEINQQVASEMLSAEGFDITIANNGREALEKMEKAAEGDFDAILMDIQMPIMDGREATEKIRALGDYRKTIPIIALTALSFEVENEKNKACGMNGQISKPIEMDQVIEVLSGYIAPKRTGAEGNRERKPIETSIEIEGIQVVEGLSRLMGNEKLYKELLSSFALKNGNMMQTLRKNLREGDYQSNTMLVHTIKGVSANLGIAELTESATKLENRFKNGLSDDNELNHFERILMTVLRAIDNFLKNDRGTSEEDQNSTYDPERLSEDLTNLLKAVRTFNMDAIALAEEVYRSIPNHLKEDFSVIMKLINTLQYDEAEKAVKAFSDANHIRIGDV